MTVDSALDTAALDSAVAELQAGAPAWVALPLAERITLLEGLKPRILAEAEGMVEAAAGNKGYDPVSTWRSEEWLTGPWAFLQGVNSLLHTLRLVADGREPLAAKKAHRRPDGQTVVDVFPVTAADTLLFHGVGAQVWMEPGVTPEQARREAASQYRGGGFESTGVALVLGAGNVGTITTLDILDLLHADGMVVVAKMNPVNDYLGPFYERIFADYVARGFVRFVYGGADVGGYLAQHGGVDRVHMTGSAATHDAIVWGVGEEAERRRADDDPLLAKPISTELGGVTPFIITPGDWDEKDLRHQAEGIVTAKLNNSGHNCVAVQVLVLPEAWPLADALLDQVRALLASLPPRPQYYPRSTEKVADAVAPHHTVERFADDTCVVVTDVDLGADEYILGTEVFGGALAVVRLPGATVEDFLVNAVAFANDRLPGTLGASIVVDPKTAKAHAPALDRAIADLRYGSIGINVWSALAFLLGFTPWGAFPGHTPHDIGSGVGVVHNAFLLHRVQKGVCWMPFRPAPRSIFKGELTLFPKPPFFVTHKQGLATAQRLTEYLATDNPAKLPGIFAAALRG